MRTLSAAGGYGERVAYLSSTIPIENDLSKAFVAMFALGDLVSGPLVLAFTSCVCFSLNVYLEINMPAIFTSVLSACASLWGLTQADLTSRSAASGGFEWTGDDAPAISESRPLCRLSSFAYTGNCDVGVVRTRDASLPLARLTAPGRFAALATA